MFVERQDVRVWELEKKLKFLTTDISGNICGDYALGVSFKNKSASQANTLCERGDLIQGSLAPGGALIIYMFRNVNYFNYDEFQCYMWCTTNGSMPEVCFMYTFFSCACNLHNS